LWLTFRKAREIVAQSFRIQKPLEWPRVGGMVVGGRTGGLASEWAWEE